MRTASGAPSTRTQLESLRHARTRTEADPLTSAFLVLDVGAANSKALQTTRRGSNTSPGNLSMEDLACTDGQNTEGFSHVRAQGLTP